MELLPTARVRQGRALGVSFDLHDAGRFRRASSWFLPMYLRAVLIRGRESSNPSLRLKNRLLGNPDSRSESIGGCFCRLASDPPDPGQKVSLATILSCGFEVKENRRCLKSG